jgi:hypothetical protein
MRGPSADAPSADFHHAGTDRGSRRSSQASLSFSIHLLAEFADRKPLTCSWQRQTPRRVTTAHSLGRLRTMNGRDQTLGRLGAMNGRDQKGIAYRFSPTVFRPGGFIARSAQTQQTLAQLEGAVGTLAHRARRIFYFSVLITILLRLAGSIQSRRSASRFGANSPITLQNSVWRRDHHSAFIAANRNGPPSTGGPLLRSNRGLGGGGALDPNLD